MSRAFYLACCLAFTLAAGMTMCCTITTPVYSRDYCVRPPHMMTTTNCSRVPTVEHPYCPMP